MKMKKDETQHSLRLRIVPAHHGDVLSAFVVEFLKQCWISKNLSWSLPAHPHLDSHTIVAQVVARMKQHWIFLSIRFVIGPLDEPVACIDGIWADVRLRSTKNTCKDSWIWTAFRGDGCVCFLAGELANMSEEAGRFILVS